MSLEEYGHKKWVAFFSQTGKEVADLAEKIGRWPDLVVTNYRPAEVRVIDSRLKTIAIPFYVLPNKPSAEDYQVVLKGYEDSLVTLHGWLRIIPPQICSSFNIFNGHPGLITKYPELRGFNKQEAIYNREVEYPFIGSVIHKVTSKVDDGSVLLSCERSNTAKTKEDAYRLLRETSLETWVVFFKYIHELQTIQNSKQGKQKGIHWVYGEVPRYEI